ncbi:hypothetical protein UP09_11710 [Bradyrhizobium sp. LTSP885]|nr:hypothetical protein UP09_11710 [Bradyrhizobium sp. LTSP885]
MSTVGSYATLNYHGIQKTRSPNCANAANACYKHEKHKVKAVERSSYRKLLVILENISQFEFSMRLIRRFLANDEGVPVRPDK